MKDYSEYSEKAMSLAIYPGQLEFLKTGVFGKGLFYVALKLQGECGEFSEKIGKCIRDNNSIIDEPRRLALLAELGDILWYCCAFTREFGQSFSENIIQALDYPVKDLFKEIENLPEATNAESKRYFFLCAKMAHCSAKISWSLATAEPEYQNTSPDYYHFFTNIRKIIACITVIALLLNSTLVDVAKKNLEKLFDRKDRNALSGSGDVR